MAKRERRDVDHAKAKTDQPAGRWNAAFLWALITVLLAFVVFLVVVAGACSDSGTAKTATTTDTPASTPTPGATTPTTSGQATARETPTKPAATSTPGEEPIADTSPLVACGDTQAPVDKQHRLPADCVPGGLVQLPASISAEGTQYLKSETANAIQELFGAAKQAGFTLFVNSAYRSYQNQIETYNYWVRTSGQEYADRTSAKPGHSEHQLGTTADVGTDGHFLEDFTGTPAAAWLRDNSWKYGFVVSYPEGKEGVTGYAPEAWHIRFVGKDVASRVHASGLTLHEYLLR